MPLRNRIDPFGEFHAVPQRGQFMGNRGGCFHRDDQTLKPTRWAGGGWIICQLEFKGRRRRLMQPGLYTEMFFPDEAVALAAGHRPCFECRRDDARAWLDAAGFASARDADRELKAEMKPRLRPHGPEPRPECNPADLPNFAFVAIGDGAFLKLGNSARRFGWSGYGPAEPLPGCARRLTPLASCRALEIGFRPSVIPDTN